MQFKKWNRLDTTIWRYQINDHLFYYVYGKVPFGADTKKPYTIDYKFLIIDTKNVSPATKNSLIKSYYGSQQCYEQDTTNDNTSLSFMLADDRYDNMSFPRTYRENYENRDEFNKRKIHLFARVKKNLNLSNTNMQALVA